MCWIEKVEWNGIEFIKEIDSLLKLQGEASKKYGGQCLKIRLLNSKVFFFFQTDYPLDFASFYPFSVSFQSEIFSVWCLVRQRRNRIICFSIGINTFRNQRTTYMYPLHIHTQSNVEFSGIFHSDIILPMSRLSAVKSCM